MLKRISALMLCILLVCFAAFPVLADETTQVPTSGTQPAVTNPPAPQYTVSSASIVSYDGTTMTVSWDTANSGGAVLQGLQVGGVSMTVTSSGNGTGTATGSIPYGTSTVTFAFGWSDSSECIYVNSSYTRSGTLQMEAYGHLSGDTWIVNVYDETDHPVSGCPISIDIDATSGVMQTSTNADGLAYISVDGLDAGSVMTAHMQDFSADGVTYKGTMCQITLVNGNTTAAPTEATAPIVTQKTPTEAEETDAPKTTVTMAILPTLPKDDETSTLDISYETVTGSTTTKSADNKIYCNLLTDSQVLKDTGLSIKNLDKNGRLILDKEQYEYLTNLYGGTMLGFISTSVFNPVTKEQVQKAKAPVSELKSCPMEDASVYTFGLSLQFIGANDNPKGFNVSDLSELDKDLVFEVALPIPDEMKKCNIFGIAMTGDDQITTLTPLEPHDGIITFRTSSLGYFTLVGFHDPTIVSGASPLKTLVIVLTIVGILMLLAMFFLIYWFFIRPKKHTNIDDMFEEMSEETGAEKETDTEEPDEENEEESENETEEVQNSFPSATSLNEEYPAIPVQKEQAPITEEEVKHAVESHYQNTTMEINALVNEILEERNQNEN